MRQHNDVYAAIKYICEKHPDANMALTSMIRLANSGNTIEFYGKNGKRNARVEAEWREFCQNVNKISNTGLDGLIDQFHKSSLQFGGMACEVVVKKDLSDIEDVYPILPQSIQWELDKRTGKWIPYQFNGFNKVDLSQGNFFWAAFDADVGLPTGSLMFESALQPLDYQLQFFEDTAVVLRRVGYPRNDLSIDRQAVIASAPASIKNDEKKLQEHLKKYFEFVKQLMRSLGPTDDLIHYNDMECNKTGGDNSRTIDLRAYNEMVDPQVLNGLSCLAILANRPTGITETWGTVQYKITVETLKGLQRNSKRLVEGIAKIWLQVHGYQLTAKFSHNPVDFETEIQKLDAALKKQQLYRRAEEYDWLSTEDAAQAAMNISKLLGVNKNRGFEYLKKLIGEKKETKTEENDDGNGDGDKTE